ncbi:hypothetical protein FN846DRAFT_910513 [Sphaerosporella brunnea]|uniref:Uncharacterized protein n=1 Tax=Sphaerosporella brunnea TaxID=1250544 RepID=A0A5J5ENF1_9PEZI|nr:hypothetical protein FN846DRAFT_910513 [Sphaerosporella brunnea]
MAAPIDARNSSESDDGNGADLSELEDSTEEAASDKTFNTKCLVTSSVGITTIEVPISIFSESDPAARLFDALEADTDLDWEF